MPNPFNMVSLGGTIDGPVKVIKKDDIPFAVRFQLDVERIYRNRKEQYESDLIWVKFVFDENHRNFALSLEKGDQIQLIGTLRTDTYKGSPLIQVYAETISLDKAERTRKCSGNEVISGQCELPH